jgi:hypothetical protein
MYIINPDKITNKIKCNKIVAQYLLERNVPLLSKINNDYYFADSELTKEILSFAPWWAKILLKYS